MSEQVAVDASVIVAFLDGEAEADRFVTVLNASNLVTGAPTVFEARLWCLHQGDAFNLAWLNEWAERVDVIAFDRRLEAIAASAYSRFGKGEHPAALNFGDAMAYAVAIQHGAPLLFKGGDFGKTDVLVHSHSVLLT